MAKQKNNQQGKALHKTKPVPNEAKRSKRASATQISPNQQTSSDVNFGGGIQIAQILFFCLTQLVTSAIRNFLCKKKLLLLSVTDYDYVKLLQKMFYNQKRKRNLLSFSKRLSIKLLRNTIGARNEICHVDVTRLTTNWKRHLLVWKRLCRCVGNPKAAFRVRVIFNHLKRGEYKHALQNHAFCLNSEHYNENTAFGLRLILYGCLTKYVAPSLRNFLINNKHLPLSMSLDVFKNLTHITAEKKMDLNYLATGGNIRDDSNLLKLCMTTRHDTWHGFFSRIFDQFRSYLQSRIQLMDVINANQASAEMQQILDVLVNSMEHEVPIRSVSVLFWLTSPEPPNL